MRLIDADAAVELLRNLGSRDYRREKGTIMDAMKMLSHSEYTPTIEAEPVVHGEWVPTGRGIRACSRCNHGIQEHMVCVNKYCPNCGARMDGSDQNE